MVCHHPKKSPNSIKGRKSSSSLPVLADRQTDRQTNIQSQRLTIIDVLAERSGDHYTNTIDTSDYTVKQQSNMSSETLVDEF